jgi:hypothetical protein
MLVGRGGAEGAEDVEEELSDEPSSGSGTVAVVEGSAAAPSLALAYWVGGVSTSDPRSARSVRCWTRTLPAPYVPTTPSLPEASMTSQTHPDPAMPMAADEKADLNAVSEPKLCLICSWIVGVLDTENWGRLGVCRTKMSDGCMQVEREKTTTHEATEEKCIVESFAGIVESDNLAAFSRRIDDCSEDRLVFQLGACEESGQ